MLEQLRILIVDDEPGGLNALGDILEDQNYVVARAGSGWEARAALAHQTFDVALLDIRLPDARGTDLLKEIREQSDSTRCIMITASPEAEDAINALNEGASAYIQKPATIPVVMATINEVVTKYRKALDERRKLRDLDIVRSIGEAAMDLDLDRMLANVLRATVEGYEADAGGILLYDESGSLMVCKAQIGLDPSAVPAYTSRVGEGFAGRVAQQNRVLAVEDLAALHYGVSPFITRAGLHACLGAPVASPQGVVGVLFLGWRESRAFTLADSHLLGVLTQRTGLAAMNARLYAQTDAAKRRAQYLATVSQELNTRIGDVREVVHRVTRLAAEWLGDGCAIFLKNAETGSLDAIESYHRDPSVQQQLESHLDRQPIRVGEGTVGRVAETGSSVITREGDVAAPYPQRSYLRHLPVASALAVPLKVHGAVIGVMSCSRTNPRSPYTESDRKLAEEFADRAAVAIENARLLGESRGKSSELQSLFEMTQVVTSSLREAQVLESLLHGTADLMGVPACCVLSHQPDSQGLEVLGAFGIDEGAAREMGEAALACYSQEVLEGQTPFFLSDVASTGCPMLRETAIRHGFSSVAAAGLEMEGVRQGALMAFTRGNDHALGSRLGLFQTLGGLAGVALTNARSFGRESTIAQTVQQWILASDTIAEIGAIQVARDYHAALTEARVGGDFYDVFELSPGQYGIVIGDVSGKGLSAALHTSEVRNTLRAYALVSASPHNVLSKTNDAVCRLLASDIFITLFYGVLDADRRELTYANAGHDAPMLCRADGRLDMLDSTGRALGLLPDAAYEELTCRLMPGDVLLLYTDGVTEARRGAAFLETEGVVELLHKHSHGTAQDVVRGVYQDVKSYAEGNLHDDIALVALKVPKDS